MPAYRRLFAVEDVLSRTGPPAPVLSEYFRSTNIARELRNLRCSQNRRDVPHAPAIGPASKPSGNLETPKDVRQGKSRERGNSYFDIKRAYRQRLTLRLKNAFQRRSLMQASYQRYGTRFWRIVEDSQANFFFQLAIGVLTPDFYADLVHGIEFRHAKIVRRHDK